jgi:hypothetical protein
VSIRDGDRDSFLVDNEFTVNNHHQHALEHFGKLANAVQDFEDIGGFSLMEKSNSGNGIEDDFGESKNLSVAALSSLQPHGKILNSIKVF